MNTNRLPDKKITFENVFENEGRYIGLLTIKEFESVFGIHVNYLDMNKDENRQKTPSNLLVSLNLTSGDIAYDSGQQRLVFEGEYDFIDGLKKFEVMEFHPDSEVQIGMTTYNSEEVRRYLSDISRLN